jgi:predicted DNA-binding protein YlxM (UPF0122 family)
VTNPTFVFKLTEDDIDQVQEYLNEGLTIKEIAERLEVHRDTMSDFIKRHGLEKQEQPLFDNSDLMTDRIRNLPAAYTAKKSKEIRKAFPELWDSMTKQMGKGAWAELKSEIQDYYWWGVRTYDRNRGKRTFANHIINCIERRFINYLDTLKNREWYSDTVALSSEGQPTPDHYVFEVHGRNEKAVHSWKSDTYVRALSVITHYEELDVTPTEAKRGITPEEKRQLVIDLSFSPVLICNYKPRDARPEKIKHTTCPECATTHPTYFEKCPFCRGKHSSASVYYFYGA